MKKACLIWLIFMVLCAASYAQVSEFRHIRGYKTDIYDVLLNPYPVQIGKELKIRIYTPYSPQSVTYVFNKDTKLLMERDGEYWRGTVNVPDNLEEGWNLSFVYIKYKRDELDSAATQKTMAFFKKMFAAVKLTNYKDYIMIEGKVWIRAYKEKPPATLGTNETTAALIGTSEVMDLSGASAEAEWKSDLKVKGNKMINFISRSLEGSKEGFNPGFTREESLRVNVNGNIDRDTELDATFISTSTTGTTMTTQNEEKVTVLVRRASTEVYFGDFAADMNETEFTRLNKSLSGIKVSGNYAKWGFKALYATPRGSPKYFKTYGDGTQGPYNLGSAPVVVDSERVTLNGIEQKRGDDYTIDYQAGTVTFRHGVVISTTIIEAYYDWRENLYQHETYALRYKTVYSDDLKLGVTYINDSDNLYRAAEIRDSLASTIEPTSHYVIGVDGRGKLGNTVIDSELALSKQDLNILAPDRNVQTGKAFKINTTSDMAPFSLSTAYKRIGPAFSAVSDASPKQDVWQYSGTLGYRPSPIYYAELNSANDDYRLSGTHYLTSDKGFKSKFTPSDIPTLNYFYRQYEDSNDPVNAGRISRMTTKHSADSSYLYGNLMSTLAGGWEERVNSFPSREVTTYKTVNIGASSYGLENLSMSGNVELKETQLPDKKTPFTKTYNANISATPHRNYSGALSTQIIDDSEQGMTNVTDLNYRASPVSYLSTDGKYTITSIKEDFNGTPEAVSKQTGSFKIDLRPIELVRYRYYYKPSFTRLEGTKAYSFSDYVNQNELTYSPIRELSTSLIYKTQDTLNMDRTDPSFKREANDRNTNDTTFLVKSAPLRDLSLEFSYLTGDRSLTEQTTVGATTYNKTLGNTKQYELGARTSLSDRFSLDSRYTYQKQDQSCSVITSDLDSLSQTVYLKGLWNIDESWIFFSSYSYTEALDNLVAEDNVTYTMMPGLGITYRFREIFRTDLEYTRSSSAGLSTTQVDTYSLRTKFDPNQYVHFNIRAAREVSEEPNYISSELMGSIEIVL